MTSMPVAAAAPEDCLQENDVKDAANCTWSEVEGLQKLIFDDPLTHAHASFQLIEENPDDGCIVADLEARAAGGAGQDAWSLTLETPTQDKNDQDPGAGHPSPILEMKDEFTIQPGETISGTAYIHNVNFPVDGASDAFEYTCPLPEPELDIPLEV